MSVKTISLSLVYANGSTVTDYDNLQFAFFTQPTPFNFAAPEVTGSGVNIAGGAFEITLHTELNIGDTGFLVLTNSNGLTTQSPSAIVFAGPVLINSGDTMTTLARNAYSFASLAEFNSFGGAVVYGEGPLWIAGEMYWSNGTTIKKTTANALSSATGIVFGDSRVEYGGVDKLQVARGWHNHLIAMLNGRLRLLRNAGISGNTSTQMLARLQTDVIVYQPDWCLMMGPVNDFISGFGYEFSVATSKANIIAIYTALSAAGIRFATATIGPWNGYTTSVQKQKQYEFNAWLKAWCLSNGIPCADEYAYLASPTTGLVATANMVFDPNGHYSDYGSGKVAIPWFEILDKILPVTQHLSTNPFDYGNLVYKGNGSNTVGGSMPAGWAVASNTAVAPTVTIVPRTDGIQGSLINIAISGGAADQGKYCGITTPYFQWGVNRINSENITALGVRRVFSDGNQYVCTAVGQCEASQPSVAGLGIGDSVSDGTATFTRYENFAIGDTIIADVEYFTDGITGGNGGFCPCVFWKPSGSSEEIRMRTPNSSQDAPIKVSNEYVSKGILSSKPIVLAGTTSGYSALITAYIDANVSGNLKIGRVEFRKYQ